MFSFHFSALSFFRCALTLGAFCLVGVAGAGTAARAQPPVPKEKVKVKAGAPEVGEAIILFSPDPAKSAIDDCSGLRAPLNQYLISTGIPTNITLINGNPFYAAQLQQTATWSLSGDTPPLKEVAGTNKTSTSGVWTINPYHSETLMPLPSDPNPQAHITPGLQFLLGFPPTSTELPASNYWPTTNAKFGVKTLTHKIGPMSFPAEIALFYPSTGSQHPNGGPEGWHHYAANNIGHLYQIPTPNWIYYYSQSFPTPNGYKINYRDTDGSGERPQDDHIHIGNDAHGSSLTPLFAIVNGKLQPVGSVQARGIDTYARVVTHESYHRAMRENYGFQWGDNVRESNDQDDDGVPDNLEADLGLRPDSSDSTGWGVNNGYDQGDGDWEVCARMAEYRVFGDETQDWADDGLNSSIGLPKRLLAPNVCQRAVFVFDDTTKSENDYIFPRPPAAAGDFTVE